MTCEVSQTNEVKLHLDRSVVNDLVNIRLQGRDSAYAAGAPARGAPLAWGRCCAEILYIFLIEGGS